MINIDNCIIYDFTEVESSKDTADLIAVNTVNTWQQWRGGEEKAKDTEQGKLAENAFIKFIHDNKSNIKYVPYDDIRTDEFKKHAPFDGMVIKPGTEQTKEYFEIVAKINNEIEQNSFGKISVDLRREMFSKGIYTVEIKSTKVNDKKRSKASFTGYDDEDGIKRLIEAICVDDFLTYPLYTRTGEQTWDTYCTLAKRKNENLKPLEGDELSRAVKSNELANMDDVYIRVYVDVIYKKLLILGYITKNDLLNPPYIKKMLKWDKSENALYFAKNLKSRKFIGELSF